MELNVTLKDPQPKRTKWSVLVSVVIVADGGNLAPVENNQLHSTPCPFFRCQRMLGSEPWSKDMNLTPPFLLPLNVQKGLWGYSLLASNLEFQEVVQDFLHPPQHQYLGSRHHVKDGHSDIAFLVGNFITSPTKVLIQPCRSGKAEVSTRAHFWHGSPLGDHCSHAPQRPSTQDLRFQVL